MIKIPQGVSLLKLIRFSLAAEFIDIDELGLYCLPDSLSTNPRLLVRTVKKLRLVSVCCQLSFRVNQIFGRGGLFETLVSVAEAY